MADNQYLNRIRNDLDEASRVIETLLPDPQLRASSINDIAQSIQTAHELSATGWNLNLTDRLLRFNAARLYMYDITSNHIGITVDKTCPLLIEFPLPFHNGVKDIDGFRSDRNSWHTKIDCDVYLSHRDELAPSGLIPSKRDLSPTKSQSPKKIMGRMKSAHSPAAVSFIANATLTNLQHPQYCNKIIEDDENDLKTSFSEGAILSAISREYKRNPQTKKACLAHYGYKCAMCGFNFSAANGPQFGSLIQAHHLFPLSKKRGERETNPETDMRPACLNCHAVIHSKSPHIR